MDENTAKNTGYTKYIGCPGCGQPTALDLQLNHIDEDLYIWFEGLCADCQHKVVDPMPILKAELNEVARKILSN